MNDTRLWIADLLAQFSGQENTLTIPRPYITITGSLEAALLLSQIVYWSDRTKMDNGWFAKSYKEWEAETTLTKRQVSRVIPALRRAGVETKVRRFNGSPTLHYRLNKEKFAQSITTFRGDGRLQNVTLQDNKKSQSSTEITPEPTIKKERADALSSTSTIKFPKSVRSYTSAHILAYQALHSTDITALVRAWAGDMYGTITEFTNKIGRQYIEAHMEFVRLNIPHTEYPAIALQTKKCEVWKTVKGGNIPVTDMLLHVSDYKPALPITSADKPMTETEHDLAVIFENQKREAELYGWS